MGPGGEPGMLGTAAASAEKQQQLSAFWPKPDILHSTVRLRGGGISEYWTWQVEELATTWYEDWRCRQGPRDRHERERNHSECNKYFFWWTNTNTNIICKRHILRMQTWILFSKPCVTKMNKNIYLLTIFTNIFEYWNILEYKKTKTKNTQILL